MAADRPTIGVFSLLPMPGFAGRLAVYARALRHRGAEVHRILCDGPQPRCAMDVFMPAQPHRFGQCASCASSNRWLSGLGRGDDDGVLTLSRLIDADRQQAALAEIAALADDALTGWIYDGHPCGEWLSDSMRNEYCGLYWQQMPDWPTVARGWLGTMVTGILAADGYLDRYAADALLVPNGRLAAERGIRAAAAARGVPVYCEDTGLRPGCHVIRRDSPACDFDFSPEWAQWADVPLTDAEETQLDAMLATWLIPDPTTSYAFSPSPTGDLAGLRESLGLSVERPVIAVFPGILEDTSHYGADRIYPDQGAWLDGIRDLAEQRPQWDVVLRLHPMGAATHVQRYGRMVPLPDRVSDYLAAEGHHLPANVRVIAADSPISSHDLLAISRLVITYVSTVGMEATLRGLPVILSGRPYYADGGFTWNQPSPDDLLPLADRLMATPTQPDGAITQARRFIFLAFLRGLHHLPLFGDANRPADLTREMQAFDRYATEAGDDLGRLCDAILGRRPLVDPPPGLPPLMAQPRPLAPATPSPLAPPGRLSIAVACQDDNGFSVDWASLSAADTLLVVIGPQRRAPDGLPPTARLLTAPTGDLAGCWRRALEASDTDWLLLLQAGETLLGPPQDLLAVTRLRPVTPALGLLPVRAGDQAEGGNWEPRLLSRHPDWQVAGRIWPVITTADGGRQVGDRLFLHGETSIRSRTPLPARVAARRTARLLRDGIEAQPHSGAWHRTLAVVLRPTAPKAADRHDAPDQPTSGRLSVAVLVAPGQTVSQATLDAIDAAADEVLVVGAPDGPAPHGPVGRYGGRLIVATDGSPASLTAAAMASATRPWLLVLQTGEQLAPGSLDALALWLQTMGATKSGGLLPVMGWPQAGQPPAAAPEQRLWRLQGGDGKLAAPLTTVPGIAVWQRSMTGELAAPTLPPLPPPPPPALTPAVRHLMAGNLPAARVELLGWRSVAPENDPNRPLADEWLITTAIALGDWSLALALADGVLETRCRRPVLAIQAATVLQLAGDVTGAAMACRLAVQARQTWVEGPADIEWQPELILASLMLATDGPVATQAWLAQATATGPLAVMQRLVAGLVRGDEVPDAGVAELASELVASGWLAASRRPS